ncbi:MAG: peptide chain release factor N(5)-glutamine methyltransferase [Verrucomicrobiota bacterium]|nr:peptide chain release factor N(5)-glutamine methyltransferase [Verrucomicrobiota bacterium]
MRSIREIQQRTIAYFEQYSVPNAKLDTDLIIAHSLGVKRLDLYLDLERPLTDLQLDALRPLVKRRALREPLQYIIGSLEFAGVTLSVDKRALIPRQETEELFTYACEHARERPQKILDLGTGSGALAIALAKKFPVAQVTAVDVSPAALSLAQEHSSANASEKTVQFIRSNWYNSLPVDEKYDLIISNPPYLGKGEMVTAAPEVIKYEPRIALQSGEEGLDDLRIIIAGAHDRLATGGLLALEAGIAHNEALMQIAKTAQLEGTCINDLSGRPRFFLATKC